MDNERKHYLTAMLTHEHVRYAQKTVLMIVNCKEHMHSRGSSALARRLDVIQRVAVRQIGPWHSDYAQVADEAVALGLLLGDDRDFLLALLPHCVPGPKERPVREPTRRVGQPAGSGRRSYRH